MPSLADVTHISQLVFDRRNPRRHTPRNIGMIGEVLQAIGPARSIVIDEHNEIVAGNGVVEAAMQVGIEYVRVYDRDSGELGPPPPDGAPAILAVRISGLTEGQKRQYAVADNRTTDLSGWDSDVLAALDADGVDLSPFFFEDELQTAMAAWGDPDEDDPDGADGGAGEDTAADPAEARATLAERFLIPPFSVLDARQGYWMSRKRQWLSLGIKSELGRGDNPLGFIEAIEEYRKSTGDYEKGSKGNGPARAFTQDLMRGEHVVGGRDVRGVLFKSDNGRDPGYYRQKREVEARLGRQISTEEFQREHYVNAVEGGLSGSGTSVFDPVLCELAYRWFSPPSGRVFDPFAGGSVRGITAAVLGRAYVGIDLSGRQIEANREQAAAIVPDRMPVWHVGDSLDAREILDDPAPFDFLFSCPPYADLEVYSDDPRDLSKMDYVCFLDVYRRIVATAIELLAPDRFAVFVVGDVRDRHGFYRNFVAHTIGAFEDAGARLYNEAVLVTPVGSLPIRVGRQMESGRKLGKTHQNVLVFCKGDPKRATAACGPVSIEDPLALVDDPEGDPAPAPDVPPRPALTLDRIGDDEDFAALAASRYAEEVGDDA